MRKLILFVASGLILTSCGNPLGDVTKAGEEAAPERERERERVSDPDLKPIDVTTRDPLGNTPLHQAALINRHDVGAYIDIKTLIAAGADKTATNLYGSTPLHLAAINANPESTKELIAAKAPLDAKDSNGDTPLHMAARSGPRLTVKALLDAGADKTIQNKQGKTAYDLATDRIPNKEAGIKALKGTPVYAQLNPGS